MAWSDDFSGAAGTPADPTLFNYETGGNGWGNLEIESYTDRASNAALDGNGDLAITARRETFTGSDGIQRYWTSARLDTEDKFAFTFGTLSARIKIPAGTGLWPAFWLEGTNIRQVGWPASGEIDIMESINGGNKVSATVHGPATGTGVTGPNNSWAIGHDLQSTNSFADDFHTYSVTKQPGHITISVDNNVIFDLSKSQLQPGQQWVFDQPTAILLNVAVGGTQPGLPDNTTPAAASMLIDSLSYTP